MKLKSILIAAGYVLSLVALLLTFVDATNYAVLFRDVIILSTAAIFCTWRAARTGGAHGILLFPFLLALYALTDAALRSCCGARVLDFLDFL